MQSTYFPYRGYLIRYLFADAITQIEENGLVINSIRGLSKIAGESEAKIWIQDELNGVHFAEALDK